MATQLFQDRDAPVVATAQWFHDCVSLSQEGDFTEKVLITPALANAILAHNPNNRNLSEKKVREYASDMANGRWLYNMEPIIISTTGELNDGQHRLFAVIESNQPQQFLVAFGASRESRTTIDQGMARTAGHYLSMQGVENANTCASIAALVIAFETTNGRSIRDRKTHAEILARVHSDPQIGRSAHFTKSVARYVKGLLTPSQIGLCHYLFNSISSAAADNYMTQVCVGENIKRGDPAFAVQQALKNMTGEQRAERIEIVFRGWVAFRQGRKLQLAKTIGSFPALI